MPDLIHTHSARVRGPGGVLYEAHIFGEPERGGTWKGWIEFKAVTAPTGGGGARTLKTDRETTQPNRNALDYWAGGLQPLYLEGAIGRAR
jgi:hypothetical protein